MKILFYVVLAILFIYLLVIHWTQTTRRGARFRYYVVQFVWDLGQRMKEWACTASGGTHDFLPGQSECILCQKKRVQHEQASTNN